MFLCSLMCGDCMPQFHVCVCETKISICNRWELEEFKTTCKLAGIQTFLEAFSLFLVYSVQTKPKNTVTFDCKLLIVNKRNKHFNPEIRLPYSNLV